MTYSNERDESRYLCLASSGSGLPSSPSTGNLSHKLRGIKKVFIHPHGLSEWTMLLLTSLRSWRQNITQWLYFQINIQKLSSCKLHVHLKTIFSCSFPLSLPLTVKDTCPPFSDPTTGEPMRQHRNSGAVTVLLLLPGQTQNCRAAHQIKMLWIGRKITSTPGV